MHIVLGGVLALPIIVAMLAAAPSAHGFYPQRCNAPSEPWIPTGERASRYEMESARDDVERYLDDVDAYIDCLDEQAMAASDSADRVAEQWDREVRAFNAAF